MFIIFPISLFLLHTTFAILYRGYPRYINSIAAAAQFSIVSLYAVYELHLVQ